MKEDPFEKLCEQLMAEIAAEAVLTAGHTGKAAFSGRVMRIMGAVPRHEFVPVELQAYAYLNRPVPIGYDKTIKETSGRLYLDPEGEKLSGGLIKAPKMTSAECHKKYG